MCLGFFLGFFFAVPFWSVPVGFMHGVCVLWCFWGCVSFGFAFWGGFKVPFFSVLKKNFWDFGLFLEPFSGFFENPALDLQIFVIFEVLVLFDAIAHIFLFAFRCKIKIDIFLEKKNPKTQFLRSKTSNFHVFGALLSIYTLSED